MSFHLSPSSLPLATHLTRLCRSWTGWYRGYALNDELAACAEAKQMTDRLGVRRLVMGHTPNFEGMVSRCNGTILLIDTGISPAYSTFSTFFLTSAINHGELTPCVRLLFRRRGDDGAVD